MKRSLLLGGFAALAVSVTANAEMYGAAGTGDTNLYIIDTNNGATTLVGDIGWFLTGLAFHPVTGELWGSTTCGGDGSQDLALLRIDPDTGAVRETVLLSEGPLVDISFAPDGTLYGWSESGGACGNGSDTLVTAELTTGQVTSVSAVQGTAGAGLDFSPDGRLWRFGSSPGFSDSCAVQVLDRNAGTKIVKTGDLSTCWKLRAGAHDSQGQLFVAAQDNDLYTLNPDGTLSSRGASLTNLSALAWRSDDLEVYSITPCRVFDTRQTGNPFTHLEIQGFYVWGEGGCGIPQSAVAVEINLTAVGPSGFGYLRAWPSGQSEPTATLMTWPDAVSISNSTAVPINNDFANDLDIKVYMPTGGQVHIVGDAIGYRTRKGANIPGGGLVIQSERGSN